MRGRRFVGSKTLPPNMKNERRTPSRKKSGKTVFSSRLPLPSLAAVVIEGGGEKLAFYFTTLQQTTIMISPSRKKDHPWLAAKETEHDVLGHLFFLLFYCPLLTSSKCGAHCVLWWEEGTEEVISLLGACPESTRAAPLLRLNVRTWAAFAVQFLVQKKRKKTFMFVCHETSCVVLDAKREADPQHRYLVRTSRRIT